MHLCMTPSRLAMCLLQAGLRPTHRDIFGDLILGDVIVGLEGRIVRSLTDLTAVLDSRRPGDRCVRVR